MFYAIPDTLLTGPSILNTPRFSGVNPYTGRDVYLDSIHLVGDIDLGVNMVYGFNSSGIRGFFPTSDVRFGLGDNLFGQDRTVNQNGYSFSWQGSSSTTTFLPTGSIQMGGAAKLIPDRTNGIVDFANWQCDTCGSSVRAERYYFTSVSPQPFPNDTLRTKVNVSYIYSPQGDMLAFKAQTALRIQAPYVSFDQSTIMNVGGSIPLIISGCCTLTLTPLMDFHIDDSAKTAALGVYGSRVKWSGRKQSYAQQDFGYLDFVQTDSGTSTSKSRFDLYTNNNNTLGKRLSVDNTGTLSLFKWSIPGQRMLVINTDNTVDTLAIPSGGGGGSVTPAALTKTDDTNVTLTLGGTPSTALLQATSITVGWTGTLADARITSSSNWNAAYNDKINSAGFSGSTLTLTQQDAGTVTATGIQGTITETDNNLTLSSNVIGTNKAVQSLTDGATITWNAQSGYNARVTLGGNRTLAITNPQEGDYYTITIVQDGTGGRTLTLPGGGSAIISTTANDSTTLTAYYRNSAYEWGYKGVSNFIFTDGNGFDGTVTLSNTTPTLSLTTTVSNTQVMFSNSGAINGSAALTFSSGTLGVGAAGSTLGTLTLSGNTSGTISIKGQAAAGTYNFNLPTTAGTSGYFLTSGGGSGTAMTWTDPTSIITIGSFGSSPNANGLSWASAILRMQPADGSNPGGVSTTSQTFAGDKTFTASVTLQSSGIRKLTLNTNMSAASEPGTFGILLGIQSLTYTDGGSARTVSNGQNVNFIDQMTIASTNAVTYSGDVSTLRIVGAPIAGSNMTFTGSTYSLFVASGETTLGGALRNKIQTVSSTTTLDNTQHTILVDASGGAVTINLPSVGGANSRVYVIKKIDASGNTVTIDGSGSQTIDGATTQTLSAQWASYTIQCDGTAWYIW